MTVNAALFLQAFQPATFQERGVAVPFTTPRLAGVRLRAARQGIEVILPNASGGRGVYVMPWSGVRSLCRPTVHDTWLGGRLAACPTVTPATVRGLAREAASAGYAGREAAAAAAAAAEAEAGQSRIARRSLTLALLAKADPQAITGQLEQATWAELEPRLKAVCQWIAPSLGSTEAAMLAAVDTLAERLSGIGIGPDAAQARLPCALAALTAMRNELGDWVRGARDDSVVAAATIFCFAEIILTAVAAVLAEARVLAAEPVRLLRAWIDQPERTGGQLARADWLLDGWPSIWALWHTAASVEERRARLDEMHYILPALPRELHDRPDLPPEIEAVLQPEGMAAKEHWRGRVSPVDLIARNEVLRAESLRALAA